MKGVRKPRLPSLAVNPVRVQEADEYVRVEPREGHRSQWTALSSAGRGLIKVKENRLAPTTHIHPVNVTVYVTTSQSQSQGM
jgi:hypothetical protein